MMSLVITIDGPAAAGKGTIARGVARQFDLSVLDTGMLYRLVGLHCHRAQIDPHDQVAATKAAQELAMALVTTAGILENPDLRSREAGVYASVYSAIPGVRNALIEYQRDFADHPPLLPNGNHPSGAVLDGRDCGTVICPNAPLKFYVTAHVDERAHRRHRDLASRGEDVSYNEVLQDLTQRDHRDMTRAVAPTLPADDAIMIDTTGRSVDDIMAEVCSHIETRLGLSYAQPVAEITRHSDERD